MTDSHSGYSHYVGIILIFASSIYLLFRMEIGLLISIIGIIIGSGLVVGDILFRAFVEPRLKDRREDVKRHKKKLVDKILKRLRDANIYYEDFSVLVTDVDDLKKQDSFELAFQHLRAYPDILDNWDKSMEKIECLNNKLNNSNDLRDYILGKISHRFSNQYMNYLLSNIWLIIERYITGKIENLNNLKIDTQRNPKYCYVDDIGIHCKKYNNKKVKRALMDLIKDNGFREKLSKIQEENMALRKAYDDKFKGYLKELLNKLENGYNLKGKCKECSLLDC